MQILRLSLEPYEADLESFNLKAFPYAINYSWLAYPSLLNKAGNAKRYIAVKQSITVKSAHPRKASSKS